MQEWNIEQIIEMNKKNERVACGQSPCFTIAKPFSQVPVFIHLVYVSHLHTRIDLFHLIFNHSEKQLQKLFLQVCSNEIIRIWYVRA